MPVFAADRQFIQSSLQAFASVRPPRVFAALRQQTLQMGSQGDDLGPGDDRQFVVAAT
jgi:hypothetical protein